MVKKKKKAIGKAEVDHIASLARLSLTDQERKKFQKQLSELLDYVTMLREINTKEVQPTSQVTGLKNITRQDQKEEICFPCREALSNAPQTYRDYFKAKGIKK